MNKPAPKIIYTRQPVANVSLAPVVRFRNTSDEGNNVKRYLENVKKHHQPELLHRIVPKETEQEVIGQMTGHLKAN